MTKAYQEFRGVNVLFKEVIADSIKRGFHYLGLWNIYSKSWNRITVWHDLKKVLAAGGVFRDTLKLKIED